jgi:CubicO group peptidase (beta-lactamase class C family)
MRTLLAGGVILLACCSTSIADEAPQAAPPAFKKTMDALVKKGFSGCVLVEQKGNVLFRKAYGMADRKGRTSNGPQMRFDTGSVTKPIVAAAILVQVRNGSLKLDAKLGDLLKDVPKDKESITVEQLLSHTSGISKSYDLAKVDTSSRDAVVASLLKEPLAGPPGEGHLYSNANYFLLAAILDSIDKRGYEQTLRETVFKPLNMKNAVFCDEKLPKGEVSPGRYDSGILKGVMTPFYHTWGHRGATGIVCSAEDLAAFTKALHTDALLNAEDRKNWLAIRKEYTALGWDVLEQPGKPKVVMHGGTSIGSRALLAWYPESDTTIVVLMNTTQPGSLDEWTAHNSARDAFVKPGN